MVINERSKGVYIVSKTSQSNERIEIVVSTYWPTKIIKTVQVKRLDKDHFHNDITLERGDAEYLYGQLKDLFDPNDQKDNLQTVPPVVAKGGSK